MKQTMKKMIACMATVAILLNFVEPTKSILQNHIQAADYTTLAENLKIDGTWTEMKYFEELDDYDDEPPRFYKIVIPSDGKIDLKVKMYMEGYAYLYTEDLTQTIMYGMRCSGNELTPDIGEEQLVLSAGTYYLKISNYDAGAYQIYVQFDSFSANDTGADSYISPFTYSLNTTITGAITPTDEEDWYKLILPKGKYTAKFISYFGSMQYVLYNSDLNTEIDNGYISGEYLTPKTEQQVFNLNGGTYYLEICAGGWYSSYGKYQFSLSGQGSVAATSVPGSSAAPAYSAKPKTSAKPKASATPKPSATASVDNTYDDEEYDDYLPLKQVHLGRVVRHKKKIKIYFSQDINADYYAIRCARNRNFNGKTRLKVVSWRKNSCVIKKLKRHRKYYIQVRSARYGNDWYFGKWSNKKAVRTK